MIGSYQMLAITWAVTKYRVILAGLQHFHIATDHNPLFPILNIQYLDEIENPTLQHLWVKSQLMAYLFATQWTKGSSHSAPDALSYCPVSDPQIEDTHDDQLYAAAEHLTTEQLQEIWHKAAQDLEYQHFWQE